jgi:hypothetical protein
MFRKPTRWWLSSAAHGNNVGMTSGNTNRLFLRVPLGDDR